MSPTTVSSAWNLLARAGAIRTDGRRGTTVAAAWSGTPKRYRRAIAPRREFALDLATGVPDPALLPDLGPALRGVHASDRPNSYLDDPVLPELGALLAEQWPYPAERITVVDGAMDALDLVVRDRLRFSDRVVVEQPSFPPLLDLLDSVGARIVAVPVDDEGMLPDALTDALSAGASAVFLQPRAHNPTGASLTPQRRAELARVLGGRAGAAGAARSSGAPDNEPLIVEDDSAGAIAWSEPISLGQLLPDRTVHIRSYSKSHGPDLRIAAVGGPSAVIDRLTERRFLGQGWTSRILQGLLLDLLTRRTSVRQVERAREEYARRRTAMVAELRRLGLAVSAPDGINLWLPVADEAAALVRLASRGIGAAAGSPFLVEPDGGPHLRITVGAVDRDSAMVARELAEAAHAGGWTGPR
jgi:DNA-binding transcriptional MocR family regulator